MTAKDLTLTDPRPMGATAAGYAWIPRMIDKARASRAGTLGRFTYPCPIDQRCLGLLGIDAETFADLATALDDDIAIVRALQWRGAPTPEEAWFDAVAYEEELQGAACSVGW